MNVIVDYRVGNLASIKNMLARVGVQSVISEDPKVIAAATKLIFPGVGAWDAGMRNIENLGIREILRRRVIDQGVPLLGICLGMQLLFEASEEGELPGLGFLSGNCKRFTKTDNNNLKVPHMGWNVVKPHPQARLFKSFPSDEEIRFYFVHSYHAISNDYDLVTGITHHGYDFISSVESKNIFGTQFHPEKSHRYGIELLKTFTEL